MKRIILLLCLNCAGADTNTNQIEIFKAFPERKEPFLTFQENLLNIPRTFNFIGRSGNSNDLNMTIRNPTWTNNVSSDLTASNFTFIVDHKPTVTETNGKWIITFKP